MKLVCIGSGYFARFHIEAWTRIPEVELLAICDLDKEKASRLATVNGVSKIYTDYRKMLDELQPDVVDLITPPATHLEMSEEIISRGIHLICQKPLAPTYAEAETIVDAAEQAGVRFMVHENFRFQPWYRTIKSLIKKGVLGDRLFQLSWRMRMGDGWGVDAYLNRQPYFREMDRLLIYETGIHFIDTFRYLLGPVQSVYAQLRRLNPVIKGEDAGIVWFTFLNGCQAIWDASRYNESNAEDARYTFGELLLEGSGGSLRLYLDGRITIQQLGEAEKTVPYKHERKNFAGDCVYFTQQHFIRQLLSNAPFETGGRDYLNNLIIQDAIYQSNQAGKPVYLTKP